MNKVYAGLIVVVFILGLTAPAARAQVSYKELRFLP